MNDFPELAGFEFQRELGRGGMAVVYLAVQRSLSRQVAVKWLQDDSSSPAAQRFLAEARTLAELSHPHIVTVFDVVQSERDAFIVMEYLDAGSLQQRLHAGLRFDQALALLAHLGDALDYAHAHGVIHRDVKPENVLFRDADTPVLSDFGIARLLDGAPRITEEGVALGTPAYMSPEQIQGERVGAASDMYSLGAMFYEMLTGAPPFAGASPQEVLSAHLARPVPALPPPYAALQPVVEGMLAKSPSARYSRMADMVDDLKERILSAGELTAALDKVPGTTTTDRLQALGFRTTEQDVQSTKRVIEAGIRKQAPQGRPTSARRSTAGMLSILALTALILLFVIAGLETGGSNDVPSPRLAVLPLSKLGADETHDYFRDGLTAELISRLSRIRGIDVLSHGSVAKYRDLHPDPRELVQELKITHVLEGSVMRVGNRVRIITLLVDAGTGRTVWSTDIDVELVDLFEAQSRVAGEVVSALGVQLAPADASRLSNWGTRNPDAFDAYLRGQALVKHFHIREQLEAARDHFDRALSFDPDFAPALAGLASAEAQIYRNFDSSAERLVRARELNERALKLDPGLVRARIAAGEIRAMSYDYAGAAVEFRAALEHDEQNYMAWDYLCWALGYVQPPVIDEAEAACRRALAIEPDYAEAYYHLARVLAASGRTTSAHEAIDYLEQHYPQSSLINGGRYWIHMSNEQYAKALETLGNESQNGALESANRAMARGMRGDIELGLRDLERALRLGYRDLDALRNSPYFAPLRADPAFQTLLRKYERGM